MRCTKCQQLGSRHRVFGAGTTTTLMNVSPGYWDENNNWVQPEDPNITTCQYMCSNGHSWEEVIRHADMMKEGIVR